MPYATARPMKPDSIPVIDISSLSNGSDPATVAEALQDASTGLGFIYIKGHGIPDEIINAARATAFQFFRSTDKKKASVIVSSKHRGWLKPGAAKMADKAKTDLKESFIWGDQDSSGHTDEDHPLRGKNQWPTFIPGMDQIAMTYFSYAHRVAFDLMRGFAIGLKLPENFFLRTADRPLSRASYVYYPTQDESYGEEQFGVAPHTDFGVLTVLCQDDTGGLQVQDVNGDWIQAPPIEGTLIVNVADLLARWTGGAYKSTPHRVVNSSGRERLSLVLAFDPNPETIIDPLEIKEGAGTDILDKITCGEYLQWRFAKAFSYRGNQT